jgi:hypothetical protein
MTWTSVAGWPIRQHAQASRPGMNIHHDEVGQECAVASSASIALSTAWT